MRIIDYLFKRNVYYKVNYCGADYIFDFKNGVQFSCDGNKYITWWCGISASVEFMKITKEEYDELHKNKYCNCEVGCGKPNIEYGDEYNILEEFNNYNTNEDLYIVTSNDGFIVKSKRCSNIVKVSSGYNKRACLKCGICLGNDLIKKFDEIIESFENYEKVNKICA